MIERYKIIRLLGRGGSSEVYLVEDQKLHCQWAMKQVHKQMSHIQEKAFLREKEILTSLQHSAIPRIVDQFQDEENYYLIMDFLKGKTLMQMLQDHDEISQAQIRDWMIKTAKILQFLHEQKPYPIIYMDVKLQNILVNENGQVHLIDYGSCVYLGKDKRAHMGTPRVCM